MPYTRAQIYAAMRNADKAGDGAAVRALAAQLPQAVPVASAPPTPGSVAAFQQRWANMRPEHAAGIIQRFSAQAAAQGPAALAAFNKRPDTQALKAIAGGAQPSGVPAAPQPTQADRIAAGAKNAANAEGGSDFTTALAAGVRRGMFGIPERLAAAGERYLPSALTGNTTNASYDNILQAIRAKTDAEMGKSTAGSVIGQGVGAVASGVGAGGLLSKGAGALVGTGSKVAQGVGNVLQEALTLRKGETAANVGKTLIGAGAQGATQAAGEGGDVAQGGAGGVLGGAAFGVGGKLVQIASRPFRDIARLSTAPQILSRFTTMTGDALKSAADAYRAKTGAEPTLMELLPTADRNKIASGVVRNSETMDRVGAATADRAATIGPDMANYVHETVAPQRAAIRAKMEADLVAARGTPPTVDPNDPAAVAAAAKAKADDAALIDNAMASPAGMTKLKKTEADAFTAPHNDTPIARDVMQLYPQVPGKGGRMVAVNPEINAVIKSAADTLTKRGSNDPLTVGDVNGIMQNLRDGLGSGSKIENNAAEAALTHLQNHVDMMNPEAGAALKNATDAYAARSRMSEGMKEGWQTRLKDSVQTGTNNDAAHTLENAYNTPEGADGRFLGQSNRLVNDLGGIDPNMPGASPRAALASTIDLSRGDVSRELAQNLGPEISGKIMSAAGAQDASAGTLASTLSQAKSGADSGIAPTDVATALMAAAHPGGYAVSKAHAALRLIRGLGIPQSRANTMVEMLYSQDPKLMAKSIAAISAQKGGAEILQGIAGTGGQVVGGATGAAATADAPDGGIPASAPALSPDVPDASAATPDAPEPDTPAQGDPNTPSASPYAGLLADLQKNENPDVLKFADGIASAESNGQHFDANGKPKISRTGAVGLMQVEPQYLPDFAKAGGLPVDHDALYHDPTYNKLVGIAQASALLRHYGGDTAKAAAAYNAGQGAVDHAAANHDNWLAALPEETQGYVPKVLS